MKRQTVDSCKELTVCRPFGRIMTAVTARPLLGTQQVFTIPIWNDQRKEVRPVLDILICVIGAVVAIMIAKQFIKDVEKEISAHDGANIEGGDDNR